MKDTYITRLAEEELRRKLKSSGCVVVSGPKFCGKSTMCERYAKSKTELKTTNAILLAQADPESSLLGTPPHLIDEWQKAPEIWNIIRNDLDKDYQFGKYILTGSTTPVNEKDIQHTGAGRISTLVLRPFSLFESGESNGAVSLKQLFSNPDGKVNTLYEAENSKSLRDVAFMVCRGGWPISLRAEKEHQLDVTENYYEGLFRIEDESDEFAVFLKNKDLDLIESILKCYARNISTQAKKTKMISDILTSGARATLDEATFNDYANTLKKLFIIYDMPAWNLNLRTSVSVRTSPTHHFMDTSIATASLGVGPHDLLNDLPSFGYFFEDFAIRDLAIYAQSNKATLKHYRDSSGQEVDAIYETSSGEYAAIEIKIASRDNIAEGTKSLMAFEKKVIASKLKKPRIKMILTSHGACYKTEEGIFVVPITCLKD